MNSFLITCAQMMIMFLLAFVGFILYRTKLLSPNTTKELSGLLLYVVTPAITVQSFFQEYSTTKLIGFGLTFVYSILFIFLGVYIGRLILGKDMRLEQYACGFSNAGFIGIPLVAGLLGVEYVFYLSAFIVAFNVLAWTYGLKLISGQDTVKLRNLIINPAVLSVLVGLFFFLTGIRLPSVIQTSVSYIANMNTPCGMMVLGTYIAEGRFQDIFTGKTGWKICLIRLILVPVASIFILRFLPVPIEQIRMVLLIASAAPCGASLAMFSQVYGGNYSYGARIVSLSTLFCPITMAVLLGLAPVFW